MVEEVVVTEVEEITAADMVEEVVLWGRRIRWKRRRIRRWRIWWKRRWIARRRIRGGGMVEEVVGYGGGGYGRGIGADMVDELKIWSMS